MRLAFHGFEPVGRQLVSSIVDADSFWVDGYFEETSLGRIHDGDPATVSSFVAMSAASLEASTSRTHNRIRRGSPR
jgi:multidrug resistance efflux pump